MSIAVFCFLVVIAALAAISTFWRGSDDAEWEARWQALDQLDRDWIAAASRTSEGRGKLKERGEWDLSRGFGRRESRRRMRFGLMTVPPFLAVAALVMAGALGESFDLLAIVGFGLTQNAYTLYRDRRIKARYQETQDRYLAAPPV